MQGNGWESGQSGGNSSDDDGTDSDYQWCCDEWHKKGRDLNRHNWRKHDHRFQCKFYEDCGEMSADKRDLNRHYWSRHKKYAIAAKLPSVEGKCEACGKQYSRKDHATRHLKKSEPCREKLGL